MGPCYFALSLFYLNLTTDLLSPMRLENATKSSSRWSRLRCSIANGLRKMSLNDCPVGTVV